LEKAPAVWRDQASRVVFLVGPARSGTSLLYKALCLHPDVTYISNWVRRFPALPELAVLDRLADSAPAAARRAVWFGGGGNAYVYGAGRPLFARLFPMPVEGEPVFRHCDITDAPGGVDDTRTPDLYRLRRTFARITRAGGGHVLLNKRIANNVRIPLLREAFPEARFVQLVRDGRAVAYSLSRVDWWLDSLAWWYAGTPRQWAERGGEPWEMCARNWVEELRAIEHGLGHVPPDRRYDLRYEDFIEWPRQTLLDVAEFCGLSPNRSWLRELDMLRFPNRNERWPHELGADVLERVTAIQHDLLMRYGYLARGDASHRGGASDVEG
jgi:omega-hydroxy-beta-dihydromenaquinone-9 sulfotransferase